MLFKLIADNRRLFIGICIFLCVILVLSITTCNRNQNAQVQQSAAVAGALNSAGHVAVETAATRAANEAVIDRAAEATKREIDHAKSPADIRRTVLDRLCKQAAHSHDPACIMR